MASLLPSAALKTTTPSSKPKVVPSLLRNRKLQKPKSNLGETATAASTNDATTTTTSPIDKASSSSVAATVRVSNKAGTTSSSIARGKKRKVAGVAIGLSRQQQQLTTTTTTTTLGDVTNETSTTEARASSELAVVVATTTDVAKETAPVIPEAQPGELRLSAFCSKFRTKRKKGDAAAEAAAAPPPPPINNNDHSDAGGTNAAASAGPVVQIVNGEIVLQESSLFVPTARKSVQEVEEEFQHVVEEETHLAAIGASYNSFVVHHPNSSAASVTGSNTRAPQHWNVEDTKLFYEALRQVGTDFGTMTSYFPTRNRKQLKRKYQIESSKHPHLIEWALNPKVQKEIDLSVFRVDPASIVVRPPSPIVAPVTATNDSATGQPAVSGDNPTEANDAIVDETTALVPPHSDAAAPLAPKKPSWLDELDADDGLFPPDMDVEDEFREEGLPDMSLGAAGGVMDEFEDSQPNTTSKAVAAPTAATLLGASAASKATAKAKKPKFKAVRSKPKGK